MSERQFNVFMDSCKVLIIVILCWVITDIKGELELTKKKLKECQSHQSGEEHETK